MFVIILIFSIRTAFVCRPPPSLQPTSDLLDFVTVNLQPSYLICTSAHKALVSCILFPFEIFFNDFIPFHQHPYD